MGLSAFLPAFETQDHFMAVLAVDEMRCEGVYHFEPFQISVRVTCFVQIFTEYQEEGSCKDRIMQPSDIKCRSYFPSMSGAESR